MVSSAMWKRILVLGAAWFFINKFAKKRYLSTQANDT